MMTPGAARYNVDRALMGGGAPLCEDVDEAELVVDSGVRLIKA